MRMRMHAHSWSSHNGERSLPNNQILIYNTFFFSIIKIFQAVERSKQNNQPLSPFFITYLDWTNLLMHRYNFYLLLFLIGTFRTNKRVCLNTHRVCSIDNWLCERGVKFRGLLSLIIRDLLKTAKLFYHVSFVA